MGFHTGHNRPITRRELIGRATGAGAALLISAPIRVAAGQARSATRYDPTGFFRTRKIEGWPVLVHRRLLGEHRKLGEEVLKLLSQHLYQITRTVPPASVARLREVRIWAEYREPHHPCMCYHPAVEWLREHEMNPEKARSVEIANSENFLIWTVQQPWMVLHELAHAYHHQVLGYDDAAVRAAYERATQAKSYESVLRINGRNDRHYALTNEREYFAELTEAYFGTNDFYPYVRSELRQHDPQGLAMIERAWGIGGG